MSGSRLRLVAAGVLAVLGAGLLVAAYAGGEPDAREPVPAAAPGGGRDEGARERVDRLRASVPRQPRRAPGPGSARPGTTPRAATGERLPPQWPELRPTRLRLRPQQGGVGAAVVPVDVVRGALELPADADRVGWWRGGSRVGAPFGTVVVAGHLDSATDPAGYLAGLARLVPGDLVELGAEGERQRYRVVRNYLLPSADLSSRSDLFVQQRRHRLLLITCGGPYDHERGRYRDNRVVEAVPVRG